MRPLVAILALLLLPPLACAQSRSPKDQQNDQGTYLGILFGPVHTALPEKDTSTQPQGVRVTHVLPDSPAARAGVRRDDVVVAYDGTRVRGCEHLAGLIHDDRPDHKIKLGLARDGQSITAEVTLTLGPALLLPGEAKSTPTAPITVAAKPLPDGKMRVTVEFIGARGKAESLVCEGTARAVNDALKQLPERERGLVLAALERIRMLNAEKPAAKADNTKR
jgi:hypothetical protein